MSMMEWIAVCGCGGGGGPFSGLSYAEAKALKEALYTEAATRVIAERTAIHDNALLILRSGKGGTKLNTVCAELVTQTADPTAFGLNPRKFDNPAWLGRVGDSYGTGEYGPRYRWRGFSILVEDSGGNLHFVPVTALIALQFTESIAALATSPNVAKIDVRPITISTISGLLTTPERACRPHNLTDIDKAWGVTIVGTRYDSLEQMVAALTGTALPPAGPVLPETLEPSDTELANPLAAASVTTTSQQTVGGTTFSPWLLVGGAVAVVAGVALLRRTK